MVLTLGQAQVREERVWAVWTVMETKLRLLFSVVGLGLVAAFIFIPQSLLRVVARLLLLLLLLHQLHPLFWQVGDPDLAAHLHYIPMIGVSRVWRSIHQGHHVGHGHMWRAEDLGRRGALLYWGCALCNRLFIGWAEHLCYHQTSPPVLLLLWTCTWIVSKLGARTLIQAVGYSR